jgi:hypothetical protein
MPNVPDAAPRATFGAFVDCACMCSIHCRLISAQQASHIYWQADRSFAAIREENFETKASLFGVYVFHASGFSRSRNSSKAALPKLVGPTHDPRSLSDA